MKTILCYGDSNTWGYVPNENRRYSEKERWPALLQSLLPGKVRIIEAGQPGRTTRFEAPALGFSSGMAALIPALKTSSPDIVLLMLGTNDLLGEFYQSAETISHNVAELVKGIKEHQSGIEVVIISPAVIYETGSFGALFPGGEQKSHQFAELFRLRAGELGCTFFDAGQYVTPHPDEGVHWPAEQHKIMAEAIYPLVLKLAT